MKRLCSAMLLASLALTGCGNSKPSMSDAQKEIERTFYSSFSNCSQIKLDEFEKLNGIENGDKSYTLQMRYVMKVIPPSQNEKLAADYIERKKSGSTTWKDEDAAIAQLRGNFDKGCWAPLERILLRNNIIHNAREFPNGTVDFYSQGFVKKYQENARMILTENGWKLAQ